MNPAAPVCEGKPEEPWGDPATGFWRLFCENPKFHTAPEATSGREVRQASQKIPKWAPGAGSFPP